jgi:NAD(P)-dependent dehydrogenase (short-subunit alcohol dehydrogenase family)
VELAGKHVVVTGAASGIGRACAARFAAEGARVVAADREEARVRAVAEEIGALAVVADVSRESEITALIATAQEHHGPIDLFFSNAGVAGPGGGPEAPDAELQATWEINVMAHVWAARALLPGWLERGEGYLLSTASAAGLLTQVSALAYSITKHAAVALAEWLAIQYGDKGIRVSCLCPQGVRTPMLMGKHGERKSFLQDNMVSPEQVAQDCVDAMRDERFLVLPHPEVLDYVRGKAADVERWLGGMRKLRSKSEAARGAR